MLNLTRAVSFTTAWRVIAVWSLALTALIGVQLSWWAAAGVGATVVAVLGAALAVNRFFLNHPRLADLVSGTFGIAATALVLVGMLWGLSSYLVVFAAPDKEWAYRWRYSSESDFSGTTFSVSRRPHDCEFLTAPLGDKHCHYERRVQTVRVRRDSSRLLVSSDDGNTWEAAAWTVRPSVTVWWEKVDD